MRKNRRILDLTHDFLGGLITDICLAILQTKFDSMIPQTEFNNYYCKRTVFTFWQTCYNATINWCFVYRYAIFDDHP